MGETKILWAGRPLPDGTIEPGYSFNPWIGCQKVSAGCQNCYAEALAKRYGWVNEWGNDYRLTSAENWKKPIQWAKKAVADGVTRRVFCASLADVFDMNVNWKWRARLFGLISETEKIGGLEWLILTKRPEHIGCIHMLETWTNIRIGITCENQEMFDKRMPIFLDAWHGKNFISYEPALSGIQLPGPSREGSMTSYCDIIDWVITGCESGPNARPCNIEWIRDMRDQCVDANIPFFLKQLVVDGKLTKEPFLDGKQWLQFP